MISTLLIGAEAAAPTFPVLPALIVVPVVTALVVALLPAARADYTKLVALVGSSITGALSIFVLADFELGTPGLQFVSRHEWVPSLGLSWFLAVDGISLFLVVLTGILFPIAILATEPHHDPKPYYVWLMLLMAGSMGAFVALDLLLFFLFFEVVLVPMYFLIGGWGHEGRVYAAMKFFLYTMAASALMLVGIVSVVFLSKDEIGEITFDVTRLAEAQALTDTAALLVFLSFAVAFAVKVPLAPVHTWLPDAHTEAPTAGSVILAGVMLKLGTYGFIRFGVYLFPKIVDDLAPIFLTLGVIGIVYGAAVATMQRDLKRLVAYSSVAHMGFIVVGIFALNTQGLQGGVLQMINHGISTGALFILVGWIYERRHTREIAALGGLQSAAPIMAAVFTLVMLSSVGLPGLNGFVGEFLILLGAFSSARWWSVVAVSGVILAALYLLWAYQRSFHGPAEGDNATMADLRPSEVLAIAPLLALIVALGVYPKPVLERIEPTVDALVAHVESHVEGFTESEPTEVPVLGVEELIATATEAHEAAGHGEADSHDEGDNQGEVDDDHSEGE
ncbi:MAG: NADH-quinone oxidoreductase subunit M [Actinomycetia bacterium]|nr:NADH-quinone oxidoreductase subunit M [Actinomycetes bacterium]